MHVGVPEDKPTTQRLAYIYGKNQQSGTVTYETYYHRKVDYVLELIPTDYVSQKTGKKSTAPKRDDRQVGPYPQGETVIIVHVCLVEPLDPAQQHGINAPQQNRAYRQNAQEKDGQRTTFYSFGYQCRIHKPCTP